METLSIPAWKEVRNAPLVATTEIIKIGKSREEGESDLINLARTEDVEANWMYSPENKMWYNCTWNQGIDPTQGNRPVLTSFLPENLGLIGNIFDFYHTHPKSFAEKDIIVQQAPHKLEDFIGTEDPELRFRFVKALTARELYVSSALPSFDDMNAIIDFQGMYPHIPMTENIVGDYGIYTINLKAPSSEFLRQVSLNSLEKFFQAEFQELVIETVMNPSIAKETKVLSREGIQLSIDIVTKRLNEMNPYISFSFRNIKEQDGI